MSLNATGLGAGLGFGGSGFGGSGFGGSGGGAFGCTVTCTHSAARLAGSGLTAKKSASTTWNPMDSTPAVVRSARCQGGAAWNGEIELKGR